ncbi:MAG TPA: S41 family peptidase, partial [Terriglobales bacterium]|nr:S41 family peptidase [Terriglobales bacterium]
DQDWKKAEEVIRRHDIRGDLRTLCNGHVQFGMLDHSIGYLRIISFYGYVDLETYQQALKALQSALDIFFHDAGHWNGLVIDVRLNQGGDDPLGFEIASRLTDKKYLAYSKVTRNNLDGALHFTAPQESWVVPSDHPGFRGKVVLLTGPDTVSAGETFTMALMGRQPHVVRIGLNTQGVFSDILGRRLPNGWRFHLPNEVYLTKDGKAFDATGVPPDVHLSFFSAEDIRKGDDAAQDAALKVLSK